LPKTESEQKDIFKAKIWPDSELASQSLNQTPSEEKSEVITPPTSVPVPVPEAEVVQEIESPAIQEASISVVDADKETQPWQTANFELDILQTMGFLNRKLNYELLTKYKDLNRVVEELLS